MLASDVLAAASTWRPQLFGDRRAPDIDDPLVEPLWTGRRVLAYVSGAEARLTDVEGEPVETHPDVVAELVAACRGTTVLLEGTLTPEPLQAAADIAAREQLAMPKVSTSMNQLVLGERSGRKDRREERADEVRRRTADPVNETVALVAVDLVWLDDQSICDVPLLERRRLLESVIEESHLVRVGMFVKPPIDTWLGGWRAVGFNRLAFKAANSRYIPASKNKDWAIAEIPRR
jgi:hypothetical protein